MAKRRLRLSMADWINVTFLFKEPSFVLAPPRQHKLDPDERRARRRRNRAKARTRSRVRSRRGHGR